MTPNSGVLKTKSLHDLHPPLMKVQLFLFVIFEIIVLKFQIKR